MVMNDAKSAAALEAMYRRLANRQKGAPPPAPPVRHTGTRIACLAVLDAKRWMGTAEIAVRAGLTVRQVWYALDCGLVEKRRRRIGMVNEYRLKRS